MPGPYSGPSRDFRAIPRFDPLAAALDDERATQQEAAGRPPARFDTSLADRDAAAQRSEDDRFQQTVATTPGLSLSGDTPDLGSNPASWESAAMAPKRFRHGGFGGQEVTYDPRVALGTELARARAERTSAAEDAPAMANAKLAEADARVQRLVQSGYSPKEAARQVHGGARTVSEERELLQTRSGDQMARDQFIQGEISKRQSAETEARSHVQMLLERSRAGDRSATLELRRAQILLQQTNREYKDAQNLMFMNATGAPAPTAPGGGAPDLNAAVDEHLAQVTSIEKGRTAAVAGVRTAGKSGEPGAAAPIVADDAIEQVVGAAMPPRAPAPVGASSTGNRAAPAKAGGKQPSPSQLQQAAKDPGYKAWLAGRGYDVSRIP